MGAVDADSFLGEAEEGCCLGVGLGEGFEATEDYWVFWGLVGVKG